MQFKEKILLVVKRPPLYGAHSFKEVACVITGIDAATQGAALAGFREWMIVKLDGDYNCLQWEALVLIEAGLPIGILCDPRAAWSDEQNAVATSALRQLIEDYFEYLGVRQSDGLRRVLVEYQKWLWKQDWYGPDWPDFIPPP